MNPKFLFSGLVGIFLTSVVWVMNPFGQGPLSFHTNNQIFAGCAMLQPMLTFAGQFLPNPLPDGCVDSTYSQEIAFKLKTDTTIFIPGPGLTVLPIDSGRIKLINNLPAGISFIGCDDLDCTYLVSVTDIGCLTISGTPSAAFNDSIEIVVENFITLLGSPQVINDTVKLKLRIIDKSPTACNITGISFSNSGPCNEAGTPGNSSDDYFASDVLVSFVNPAVTGNLMLSGPGVVGTVSVPVGSLNSATAHTFPAVQMIANGLSNQITAVFDGTANTCIYDQNGPAISPCSVSECPTLQAQLTYAGQFLPNPLPDGCVDSVYSQEVAFKLKKDTTIFIPGPGLTVLPIDSGRIKLINNLPAGISFIECDDPDCTYIVSVTDLGCLTISGTPSAAFNDSIEIVVENFITLLGSPQVINDTVKLKLRIIDKSPAACNITGISFSNAGPCNEAGTPGNSSDDYFTSDVLVSFVNPAVTGNLVLSGPGVVVTVSVPVGSLNSATAHTFPAVQMIANGLSNQITAVFDGTANTCIYDQNGPAISPCSVSECPTLQAQLTYAGQFLPNPLPDGCVDSVYSQEVAFKLKKDTTIFIPGPGLTVLPIDSGRIKLINNLPAGISFIECDDPDCTYIVSVTDLGCLTISGTPGAAYNDSIEIIVENWITILGSPQPLNDTVKLALKIINKNFINCPTTFYVDSSATGLNNGTSWANAFNNLQDALLLCDVDTIFVAHGTYYPDTATYFPFLNNDRTLSFNIPDSAVVLGGYFGGTGPDSSDRDLVCNKTILSGDIDHNGDTLNNSYHVVQTLNVSSATVVDGFCITGGNANGDFPYGGGWYNNGAGTGNVSNPTIRNCVLSGNSADLFGGAMFNIGGSGGTSSPMLTNCVLSGNSAGHHGGAMYNSGSSGGTSSPILTNCVLSGNTAGEHGGAMYNSSEGTSSPILTNCVLSGNSANNGGAMYNNVTSGGTTSPVMINCIFWNNEATNQGPVFYNSSGTPQVSYSILQGISMNSPSVTGGDPTMDNGNNKFEDPLFVNAPPAGLSTAGNFHVLAGSPAIDMGENSANTYPTDLDGKPRIQNGFIDIGVYEFYINCDLYSGLTRIYVDSSATGANNGLTWDSAFTDLQDALAVVRSCGVDTILVAQGTYFPSDTLVIPNPCNDMTDILEPNRSISFNLPDSAVVLGGYLPGGSETRDWVCNKTILSGEIQQDSDSTNNSYHVVQTLNVSSATVVDGFCITGGNANGDFPYGGGWYNNGTGTGNVSNPTIRNCVLSGNSAGLFGGAMFNIGGSGGTSSPILINCVLSRNSAGHHGGAMYNSGSSGGTSSPILTNCVLSGNTAGEHGGAMYNSSEGTSSPILTNCVLSGNTANNGGAMYNNVTSGGTTSPVLINCIFWNNEATNQGPVFYNSSGTPQVSYSILQGISMNSPSVTGGGPTMDNGNNKFVDPLFVNAPPAGLSTAGNFHVMAGSPAIDMGDNSANTYPTDLDGKPRIFNLTIDIGAYEFADFIPCAIYSNLTRIYVDSSAMGANNGLSWDSAFTDLQDALAVVRSCGVDTILVAKGTYYPSDTLVNFDPCGVPIEIILPDRTISFNIPDSAVVLGGFPTGGNGPRDWVCNKTILCGDIGITGDTSDNNYHVVVTTNVDSVTVIDGFCISGGNASGMAFPNTVGGGWYNDGSGSRNRSNPTIINCIFTLNHAVNGAGLFNQGSVGRNASPRIYNCIFSANSAALAGGGIYNNALGSGNSNPVFVNSIISGNTAGSRGGGLYNQAQVLGTSNPRLVNCVINGNLAGTNGGGMYNNEAHPIMVNSMTWNNSTAFDGAGTFSITISYSITQAGAVYTDAGNNKPDGTDPLFLFAPSFTAAPTAAGDFHVMTGSPAINMGDNAANTYPTDLDGMARISEGIIDIGPYEKLLNCDTDTLFVLQDGTIPSLAVDSLLLDTIPEGCILLVNGIAYTDTDSIPFSCDQYFDSNLDLLLICGCDTIESCTKIVVLIDSFEKNLVCNDLVNISLGNGCLHVVTTDDVLENIMGCRTALYDVELSYPLGTHKFPPANDLVDESHIGYTMVYSVYETLTGNKCWGYLKVEDKLPPLLNCIDDTIACYELPNLPLLVPNADDCYDGKVELISDEWFDYGCDSVFSGYVLRTVQGTDRWGNFRRCTRTIFIERTVLDSVECPDLVELPCEIRTQIGGGKTLKTPIVVDQSKITPTYLLSLQKKTWEFTDNTKDWILNPSVQVVPQIQGQNIYPGAAGICKISSTYKDTRLDVCGAGFKIYREWTIVDWCSQMDTICGQYIKVTDTEAPVLLSGISSLDYNTSAHDCVAAVTIPALIPGTHFRDCNMVDQTYTLQYDDPAHPGKIIVLTGTLPSSKLFLPVGDYKVEITLVDKCYNRTITSRIIEVHDITPPTPVCDEFTQVTLDPVTCWAKVKAKDLDNGSRDNCCDVLHFAAAQMDSITYWRNYWTTTLEAKCGTAAFWHDKEFYDEQIERWINAYVFKDEIAFSECGNSQVVLRVYEACGVPLYDPHVWPCSEHQWFWYNTNQQFRIEHNWNYFHSSGPKDCNYRYTINCIETHQNRLRGICEFASGFAKPGGLCYAQYLGAVERIFSTCDSDFYIVAPANSNEALPPGSYCSARLYSDCMINVLVDDKQAPVVAELEDVIVYCDRAPENAYAPNCMGGEEFKVWPGSLKDKKGVEHGYYGGSDFLGIHQDEHETGDPCGYDNAHHWAPIYCRSWLYLDSFDSAGKIDPKQYFETLVLFDKTRATRTLLASEFSITDNCRLNDTTLKMSDEGILNGCGEGWIQRTWTIQDKCGNTVTAKQKVVVKHRSDFEVIFPEDKVVECDFLNTTDPKDAGEPIISDDECEQVGVQYKDEVFTVEDNACYKIVRTWTLIDWCIYNPNAQFHYPDVVVDDRFRADTGNRSCVYRHLKDNNDGYMKYIQVIKVIDKVAPTVTTRDTTICIYSEDCKSSLVRIPFNATDNCTATSELSYRVEVDLNATSSVFTNRTYVKSSIDQTTQSNQIEFVYSPSVAGKHVVHVMVKDNCGNEDTSSYRFELVDCKKPTPYCYNGVATVIMPSNSKITVWAKDLDAGSLDNCTLAANLKFSFSSNSSETSKEFTCADIPDGKSKTIPVDIWVTDEAGNHDHCSTYILLQDNSGNVCPDVAGLSVTIAGTVQTETKEPIEHVRVNIYGGALQMNYQTGIKGTYHFEGLPSKSNYSLKSTRDDQPMNGVSTLDLVLIQKHILGIELLDSPYKVLAADVDNDKQITAIDLVELRKLILATYEDLPNNESWRFIPKSTTFSDPQNPWNAGAAGAVSEVLEMKEVTTDYKSEDFVGLKVGDVNATAAPHSLMGVEVRGNETGLLFEVTDQVFNHGDIVRVDFRSPNFRGISGWQGTLNISDQLSGISGQLISGSLSMTDQNMGMRFAKEGMITMSWNTNAKSGLDIDDQQVLFTLVFKAQENGKLSEVLRIGSQHTIAESYEGKGELGNLSIRFVQNGNEIVAKSELYQNYPNPFDQRTVIGINLAGQGKGTLKVYDATGRTIKSVERDWTKGYHEVWFDRKEIGASGVLYYRFESGFFNASKKMILMY